MRAERPRFDYKFLATDELVVGIREIRQVVKINLDYVDRLENGEVLEPTHKEARRQYIQSILDHVDDAREEVERMEKELATRA